MNETRDPTLRHSILPGVGWENIAATVFLSLLFIYKSVLLGDCTLCGVDSTELANDCKIPLVSLDIKGKKIRIYGDIDSDYGPRCNKRDKSVFVVGYRLHTLTVINAHNGQSFPLASLVAPANHHDKHLNLRSAR
jgi:hypothetical protein